MMRAFTIADVGMNTGKEAVAQQLANISGLIYSNWDYNNPMCAAAFA